MKKRFGFPALLVSALVGILICALVFGAVFMYMIGDKDRLKAAVKFSKIYEVIEEKYIGDADMELVSDTAYRTMLEAIDDRWSYYMTADEFTAYKEYQSNSYTGIGITIMPDENGEYLMISGITEDSPADRAGVHIGDKLQSLDNASLAGLSASEIKDIITSKNGEEFELGLITTDGSEVTVTVSTEVVFTKPVKYEMLDGDIGYVKIKNFEDGSGSEAVEAVDYLISNGATGIVFDVRNNPGGKLSELLKILDHLLPEGEVFVSVNENGEETVKYSDAECVNIPMTVLVNANSYSAAEFFAEALSEFDVASIVGSNTTGKSRSQINIFLDDGSAIHLSTNGYLTPKRTDLAEQGGIVPDVVIDLDDEDAVYLNAGQLPYSDDEQLQAAISELFVPDDK